MRITGTFLDEITHDIPSQNWSETEWRREFELYSRIGIDTVILIRCGYKDRLAYPSKVVPGSLPVYEDLVKTFLDLAAENGINFYFGTYDSGDFWLSGQTAKELDLNKAVIDEVGKRYASHPAFKGWYMCHETSGNHHNITHIFRELGGHCKSVRDLPVLISPFPMGAKQAGPEHSVPLAHTMDEWNTIFAEAQGAIDICAFQDGQIHYHELPEFHAGISHLGREHGVSIWSNVESFDRDMPIKFPPANWPNLRLKLEEAAKVVEKIITFEFAHFMSPYSCYPAAHKLFERYCHHFDINN